MNIRWLSKRVAVAQTFVPEDVSVIAALGYRTIVNFRLDSEVPGEIAEASAAAAKAEIRYIHIPAAKYDVFDEGLLTEARLVFETAEAPILTHCQSGQRAAIIWGAIQAQTAPVEDVLRVLTEAGFELDCLSEEFEQQAGSARASPAPNRELEAAWWLWQRYCDTSLFAHQDLFAFEVTAVSDRFEFVGMQCGFCHLRHIGEL